MKKVDKELERLKFIAFGKVKEKSNSNGCKELVALQKEKEDIFRTCPEGSEDLVDEAIKEVDEKMASIIFEKQRIAFEAELDSICKLKTSKGKAAAVFSIKDRIVGSKSAGQEATILVDPKSKTEVSNPEDIKRVSLQYCVDLLTNRKPKEEFEEDICLKKTVHMMRMEEIVEDDLYELSTQMFDNTLKKKIGAKYQFIFKGGLLVKEALFKLCRVVWSKEKQPDRWEKSTLVQLYKGKGPRSILDNMRHIHCKDEFPKFFGHLVVSASKDKMISNLTKYQIATKPGHRAQEHLFVLKSIIALYIMLDKAIITSMWDLSKFFDRESLHDCLNELYKSNVRGKLYRLLYSMNKNTRISIQTPVGLTAHSKTSYF